MSSNVKIVAALLGCLALAFLWLGRDSEPAAPEAQPEFEKSSASVQTKPKRHMLLNQAMDRPERERGEPRRQAKITNRLEARSKKLEARRARALQRTPSDLDEGLDHWRNVVINDPDPDERADALTQLDYEEPGAMAVLAQALQDRDVDVRLSALDELWVNADEPPLDLLAPVLNDPEAEVRAEAVRMIAESEDPQAAALLETALGDPDEDVRGEAADALDIDEDTLEPLF